MDMIMSCKASDIGIRPEQRRSQIRGEKHPGKGKLLYMVELQTEYKYCWKVGRWKNQYLLFLPQ
jgi:hypothetical protein